jgi:hypothetical protein
MVIPTAPRARMANFRKIQGLLFATMLGAINIFVITRSTIAPSL